MEKVQIYTYHFPDGKIYIGFTSASLKFHENEHKTVRSISPIKKYLTSGEKYEGPILEKTVTLDIYDDELYKIQRKILDKYTNDTTKIINKNLKLFGY